MSICLCNMATFVFTRPSGSMQLYGVVLPPPRPWSWSLVPTHFDSPGPSVACGVVSPPHPLWCGVVGLGCLTPPWWWVLGYPDPPLLSWGVMWCAVVVGCGFQV